MYLQAKGITCPPLGWGYVGMPHISRSAKGEQEVDFAALVFIFHFAEATILTLTSDMNFLLNDESEIEKVSLLELDFHPFC